MGRNNNNNNKESVFAKISGKTQKIVIVAIFVIGIGLLLLNTGVDANTENGLNGLIPKSLNIMPAKDLTLTAAIIVSACIGTGFGALSVYFIVKMWWAFIACIVGVGVATYKGGLAQIEPYLSLFVDGIIPLTFGFPFFWPFAIAGAVCTVGVLILRGTFVQYTQQ